MKRRRDLATTFHEDGRAAFAFLADRGFTGAERAEALFQAHVLEYQRPDLSVQVTYFSGREPALDTRVDRHSPGDATSRPQQADLACLYVACGLGPPQHVPSGAPTPTALAKRLSQHATALQAELGCLSAAWTEGSISAAGSPSGPIPGADEPEGGQEPLSVWNNRNSLPEWCCASHRVTALRADLDPGGHCDPSGSSPARQ